MMTIVWTIIYIFSILFAYLGVRSMFIVKNWDGDLVAFIVIFIPGVNVTWGFLSFVYACICCDNATKFFNSFFLLNKKDKFPTN